MKKSWYLSVFIVFIIFLLPSSLAGKVTIPSSDRSHGDIIYVDGKNVEGPWDGSWDYPFRYIQDGINASETADAVFVFNGTYNETIVIRTAISLIGDTTTIIDGTYHDTVVTIIAEEVTIQKFIIRNSGGYPYNAGIHILSNHNVIENCTISRTQTGILIDHAAANNISNCTVHNTGIGIRLLASGYTLIEGCTIGHTSIGIAADASLVTTIRFCYLHTNGQACVFNDSYAFSVVHCNISDNSVNHGGLFFRESSDITITDSIINHNGAGISIGQSQFITVSNNTIRFNTHYGLWIEKASSVISVSNCEITNNKRIGVYAIGESTYTLFDNNIEDNLLYGLYTKQSHGTVKHNYWGSLLGPSRTLFGSGERVRLLFGRLSCLPWLNKPLENIGAGWENNEQYLERNIEDATQNTPFIQGTDSDADTAPDWWEVKWGYNPDLWDDHSHLDPDEDGLTNLEECYTDQWGSSPFHKDIFLEIDWMLSKDGSEQNKPDSDLIEKAVDIFADHNITVHVDLGTLGGGEVIPYQPTLSFTDVRDLYWDYFLHNNLTNSRKGIFHYGIVSDSGPDSNFPFFGWNQFDAFFISAQTLQDAFPLYSRDRLIVVASIHHLGHSLGLLADSFNGIDNIETLTPMSLQWFMYRNYKSSMNYYYKFSTLSYSDGTHGRGDFDDWNHLNFSFFKNSNFRLS